MKNKTIVRIITAIVTLCMFLSMAPVLAFGEDGGDPAPPAKIATEAVWTYNADGTYQDLDNPSAPSYYYDGNAHYPTVVVTYTDDEGVKHELDQKSGAGDTDYDYAVYYTNVSISSYLEIQPEECTGDYPQWTKNYICYTAYISMNDSRNYAQPDDWRAYFYIVKQQFNIEFLANYDGANPSYDYYGTIYWKQTPDPAKIPTFTREGYTFDGWYQDEDCTVEFEVSAPFQYNVSAPFYTKTVYAKWVKDDTAPGGDPTPEGDGTEGDGTNTGGKTQPDTGVENMMALFIWLFAVSAMIIVSVRKKRA